MARAQEIAFALVLIGCEQHATPEVERTPAPPVQPAATRHVPTAPIATPTPPPPPPVVPKTVTPKKIKPVDTVQPVKREKYQESVEEYYLADEAEGVEGGIEGGVLGGDLSGGVVGDGPLLPPPPPPKP